MLIALYTANAYSCAEREMSARAYSVYGWLLLLPDPVYTIQPVVKPAEQPAATCKQTFNRLSNWLFNRFNNRLYRVNAISRVAMNACWSTLVVCWLATLTGVDNEMFTAVIDMKRMFRAEHDVARLIKSYVQKQHGHLAALSRYVTSS